MKKSIFTVLCLTIIMIGGCKPLPTPQQLVGSWESTDKTISLDFRKDGVFTSTQGNVAPASLQDMIDKISYCLIAPSGTWSLQGSELTLVGSSNKITLGLKIESVNENVLVLRFGDAAPMKFERKKQDEKPAEK
jgi:hypothetical protein